MTLREREDRITRATWKAAQRAGKSITWSEARMRTGLLSYKLGWRLLDERGVA